jgi:hypothetical protein
LNDAALLNGRFNFGNASMEKPTSFANDILPLFTSLDIKSMAWFCDLTSYDDVKANAPEILNRLNGIGGAVMPPPPSKGGDGPWTADNIALFASWIDDGYPA